MSCPCCVPSQLCVSTAHTLLCYQYFHHNAKHGTTQDAKKKIISAKASSPSESCSLSLGDLLSKKGNWPSTLQAGMASPILPEARTQTMFCRLAAAQNQGTASYWASPTRAQGVHAFVGWHFHPLSHYFEIRALRSQMSWQGFSPSSSQNLGCCCTLCQGGRFQNLKPHLCWYCAHQSSTGSSPVSRICIKPPQKGMGKRENQPNLLQEQYPQPPVLSNKKIFHCQKSQICSSHSAPRESYSAIPKLQLRAGAGRSVSGASILSLHILSP